VLLKLPAKTRVVVPSLAIAAASVVLGLGWFGVHPGANWRQIAMVDQKTELGQAALPMATPAPAAVSSDIKPLNDLAMDADWHDPAAGGG
jgi:hypothetical protein